jgi:bifunctional non-homologous end joining protein LigD
MSSDPLALYNAKRDFAKTAEPAGTLAPGNGNSFIVQKHDATRLHWDFRLELDGVLKSWAVTRGPSLDPNEKRLAVRTEDHPLSYATFEGTIPKGEYGGGTVMLWDRGTWSVIKGKSPEDLEKGHLHFVLDGERMKGEWLLIRLKPRGKEKRENWLLRKIDDGYAGGTLWVQAWHSTRLVVMGFAVAVVMTTFTSESHMSAITRAVEKGGAQVGPSVAAVGLDGHEMEDIYSIITNFRRAKLGDVDSLREQPGARWHG